MKAIIFGVDGTILDTQDAKATIFSQYLNELWQVSLDKARDYWFRTVGGPRRSKFEFFYKQKFQKSLSDEEYRELDREFGNRLKSTYQICNLIPGATEALVFARNRFDKTFAITGTTQEEIDEAFEYRNISKYFDKVYGTSEALPDKKAHLQDITLRFKPRPLVLVSHSKEDIQVGKEFNGICIGVTSIYPKKELLDAGASETLPDLLQLPGLLKTKLRLDS
jgi:phosphoglycolate phosphatase-like HAD superfamily hydrolase